MGDLLTVIVPVFLVIGFGYITVKRGLFPASGVDGLVLFSQKFAIPCLLFNAIAHLELGVYFEPLLLLTYYLPALTMFGVGIAGARFLFGRPWPDSVAIGFACLFSNTVLLGLPITERAYGADALDPNFAIIALNAPVCYIFGIAAMEIVRSYESDAGKTVGDTLRAIFSSVFHNSLVIAILLGFAVNLLGLSIPTVLDDALNLMIRAALPAAVFSLGGVLAQYKIEGDTGPVILICVCTLLIQPALSYGLAREFDLDVGALRSAVLTAAMAPGINAYVFANMYGVAKRVIASSVLIATGLSVLSVWGWLAVLS
ncbi:MAG: AEC family transporter [Litoreibacter sp.]